MGKVNICVYREMREGALVQVCFSPDGNEERGRVASPYYEYEMIEIEREGTIPRLRISYPIFSLQNGRSEIEFVDEHEARRRVGDDAIFAKALKMAGW